MRIGMLSPIAWRTPPRHYGPWEYVTSLLTEELIRNDIDVTLFATADSITFGKLDAVAPEGYEENRGIDAKVWSCLHIANCFEKADKFDLIHNNFDFEPLSYSRFTKTPVLTTIHGFSSNSIMPVYERYNDSSYYVSISNADRAQSLSYVKTVYHGININQFTFNKNHEGYLMFFGRIHPDKGAREAIDIARKSGLELVMAGIIQDETYFRLHIEPHIDGKRVHYLGSIGPQDRDKVLGNAMALLHPINFNEPFGLSVVEAMACGTPVVAFSRGSMPEIISHGENGYLVTNVKEAVHAIDRIDYIQRETCRSCVENRFTVERMAKDYIEVYKMVIENYTS